MFTALKELLKRHWPLLRLRTILLGVLLFVVAMPVAGAVFLRLYENTLVRQTESELIAQAAALEAMSRAAWPGARPDPPMSHDMPGYYRPQLPTIDLSSTPILPERPRGPAAPPPSPDAAQAARVLAPVFEHTSRTTLASIILLDAQGRVATGSETGTRQDGLPEVAAALAGRSMTVLRHNDRYRPRYHFEWLSRASNVRIHYARPVTVNGRTVGVHQRHAGLAPSDEHRRTAEDLLQPPSARLDLVVGICRKPGRSLRFVVIRSHDRDWRVFWEAPHLWIETDRYAAVARHRKRAREHVTAEQSLVIIRHHDCR